MIKRKQLAPSIHEKCTPTLLFLALSDKYIFFLPPPPPPPLGLLFMPQFILQHVKRKFLSDAK